MNTKPIIRRLTKQDVAKVSRQIAISYKAAYAGMMNHDHLASIADNRWESMLESGISRGDICLVAELGNEIVGSTLCSPSEKAGCAVLNAIYLLPPFIGQGLGHQLYSQIEQAMRGQGYQCCELELLRANKRAARFYLSNGFVKTADFIICENGRELACERMSKAF